MSDAFELEICQGKYRYRYEAGKQEVWRNGEPWEVMNGRLIGDKFVFSLAVELDEALKERDALRAKIERMEQQEPVWFIDERGEPKRYHKSKADYCKYGGLDLLYTLPGAKGEKK